ncbi:hypothetical protein [Citricoccus alkalitolerans]|uniref:YjeF C-terminal domain-containing protein n=1 Tax=Citricoccus alkalitolerans TaxID=246603 RepID=A0ABV8XU02_9MICC
MTTPSRLAEVINACVDGGLPLVLDASALGLVELEDLDRLRAAACDVVLAPHQGELLKLVDRLAPDIAAGFTNVAKADPVAAARRTPHGRGAGRRRPPQRLHDGLRYA